MNKTIYLTYKKDIPDFVFTRWNKLNEEYKIDFSLNNDCIRFLYSHFNKYIVDLFIKINVGMYKADLWRLCKLYINGGVYADVDLVPYINIDTLDKDVTFYSCLAIDNKSIFQAFMVNFSKPKNPLFLQFLISFLLNNPYNYSNGPTYDMYNCIKHNLDGIDILPEKKYEINEVKILVNIGSSNTNTKNINLYYFPNDIEYDIRLIKNDNKNKNDEKFVFSIKNNILTVTKLNVKNTGWKYNYSCNICIQSKETVFFFKEQLGENNNWVTSYVTFNNKKILDSRDVEYFKNKGW